MDKLAKFNLANISNFAVCGNLQSVAQYIVNYNTLRTTHELSLLSV